MNQQQHKMELYSLLIDLENTFTTNESRTEQDDEVLYSHILSEFSEAAGRSGPMNAAGEAQDRWVAWLTECYDCCLFKRYCIHIFQYCLTSVCCASCNRFIYVCSILFSMYDVLMWWIGLDSRTLKPCREWNNRTSACWKRLMHCEILSLNYGRKMQRYTMQCCFFSRFLL